MAWPKGVKRSSESRARMSAARKAAWADPEVRARMSAGKRRRRRPAEVPATWGEMLAWAAECDPDLVLRGSCADRVTLVNELRDIEGLPRFLLVAAERAAA